MRKEYEPATFLDLVLVGVLFELLDEELSAEEVDLHAEVLELVHDE